MSLTYPVFVGLSIMIKRIRADKAIDEFYKPYAAVKFGKDCYDTMIESRGNIFLEAPDAAKLSYTPEQLEKAKATMRRINEERKKAAAQLLDMDNRS